MEMIKWPWLNAFFLSFFLFLETFDASPCSTNEIPVVRNISELPMGSYGVKGLSHTTVAGSILHGMKDMEIWLETFSPGARTPIHRCGIRMNMRICTISRPSMKPFEYEDWSMPHTAAKPLFPLPWDAQCLQSQQKKDEL